MSQNTCKNLVQNSVLVISAIGQLGALTIQETCFAQTDSIFPNVEKSEIPSPKSYTGIGGTLGLTGKTTALGTSGLSILSKTVLTDLLAIHGNMVVFGSATTASTNALTLNFPIRDSSTQEIMVSPFLGAGVLIRNDGAIYIDPLVVGGLDIPLSKTFTGTIRIQAGFPSTGKADVGLSAGIGYNF